MSLLASQPCQQSSMNSTDYRHTDNDINLTGLFNLNKLEQMLTQMYNKLQSQTNIINELQLRPTIQQYNQLQVQIQSLTNTVEVLQNKYNDMEQISDIVNEHATHIENIESTLENTPTNDDLTQLSNTLTNTINTAFQQLNNDKINKSMYTALEHSNKEVNNELRAVQALLAHKIDRSELPLLEQANHKLSELNEFQLTTQQSIEQLTNEQIVLNRLIQGKESKEAIVARMQAIHQHLQRKVDVVQYNELQSTIQSYTHTQQSLNELINSHDILKQQLSNMSESGTLHDTLDNVMKQLNTKLDQKHIDIIQADMSRYEQKLQHDKKIQNAYVSELKQQIHELQEANVNVEQKLSVALKFVDWFTESRLGR